MRPQLPGYRLCAPSFLGIAHASPASWVSPMRPQLPGYRLCAPSFLGIAHASPASWVSPMRPQLPGYRLCAPSFLGIAYASPASWVSHALVSRRFARPPWVRHTGSPGTGEHPWPPCPRQPPYSWVSRPHNSSDRFLSRPIDRRFELSVGFHHRGRVRVSDEGVSPTLHGRLLRLSRLSQSPPSTGYDLRSAGNPCVVGTEWLSPGIVTVARIGQSS
jgi:hypothetical protein